MDTILAESLNTKYEVNNNSTYELVKELKFYKTSDINHIQFYHQFKTVNTNTGYKIEVLYGITTLSDTGTFAGVQTSWYDAMFGLDISTIVNGYCTVKIYFKQNALHIRGINLVLKESI